MESNLTELSDEALVELCRKRGDRDDRLYSELFRRHRNDVWRVAYRVVADRGDAEDLVQEVFFTAFRRLDQFEGRSTFGTWLHRIAINLSLNEIRRRARRPTAIERRDEEDRVEQGEASTGDLAGPEVDRRERLSEALARLPGDQYEALHLKDLEERSYEEVAETLGISLSAAKMRVQRARAALRAALREQGAEGDVR